MFIPKISQVPLQQTMYANGVMSQVWIDFFERLATLKNEANLIDLIELAQRVGELPSQAIQGQQGFDLAQIKNKFELSALYFFQPNQAFDFIPIQAPPDYEIPPIQAVFLCPEQSFCAADVPTLEVITP